MIRQSDWKYVAFGTNPPYLITTVFIHAFDTLKYQSYQPQLFNLTKDPFEVDDVSLQFPDVVTELDALLNSVIDYKAVDALVKKQDYENYLAWQSSGHSVDYIKAYWNQEYLFLYWFIFIFFIYFFMFFYIFIFLYFYIFIFHFSFYHNKIHGI